MPKPLEGYVVDVLELLEGLGPVQARAMFGGWGLYLGGRMFCLIAGERYYFKVDEQTQPEFQAAGGEPFIYESKGGKRATMSYWTPPPEVVDDRHRVLPWARRAVEAAARAGTSGPTKAKRPARKSKR